MNPTASPLLSVIVPVYKVEEWLRPCLDSICNQTYRNLEIICVNDCSPDNSAAILAEYAARDPRIRVINREKNGGISAARNTGLDAATGELITFVDSDDYLELNTYEHCVPLMQGEIDAVYFSLRCVGEDSPRKQHIEQFHSSPVVPGICKADGTLFDRALSLIPPVWNKLFRRSLIERYRLRFVEGYRFEDTDFSLRYGAISRYIHILDVKFYIYHIHNSSFWKQCTQDITTLFDLPRLLHTTLQFLKDLGFDEKHWEVPYITRRIISGYSWIYSCGYRKEADRELRSLVKKWKLDRVPLGDPHKEALLKRMTMSPQLSALLDLFVKRNARRINYRFFGLTIFSIYTEKAPHRYRLLGVKFGAPVGEEI